MLALFLAAAVALHPGQANVKHTHPNGVQADSPRQTGPALIVETTPPPKAHPCPRSGYTKDEDEVCRQTLATEAQVRIAKKPIHQTWILIIVGVIQSGALIFTLLEVGKATRHAARSADAARDAQRAWVRIDGIKAVSDMVRSDDGIRMTFEVALTNIGKGPATNVEIWTPMACGAGAASPLEARAMVPDYGAGRTMFPDEPIVQLCGAVLKQGQINAASDQSRMFNRIAVGVLVSVKYKFAGGIGKTTQFYNLIDEHILEQIEMSDLPTTDKISLRRVYTQDTAS